MRNYSIYPAPPHAGDVRFRTAEGIELEPVIEKVRAIVEAHPHVLADPAPSVLLDRSAAENALEIVVAFFTAEDEIAAVKSDLIKAVRAAVDTQFGKPIAGDVGPSITERTEKRPPWR